MTALIARPPLQILSMSSIQSGSRRHSARLQQKEDNPPSTNGATTAAASRATAAAAKTKKRKAYDEDDDGFVFSRVTRKKARQSLSAPPPEPALSISQVPEVPNRTQQPEQDGQDRKGEASVAQEDMAEPAKKRKKKCMSFSTPGPKQVQSAKISHPVQPVRRSRRLSTDAPGDRGSPVVKDIPELKPAKARKDKLEKQMPPLRQAEPQQDGQPPHATQPTARDAEPEHAETHSSTKIALPFADTPVISRNKAMRDNKSGKSERRSSLGLRGRRASSLIESGTSSALPHAEVDAQDFYKHIESELLEPRRMKQLLTWCATRAMHPKPQGTSFEEASARSAARVIEEELLKDLANRSELSDWFSREDAPAPVVPLPERPNPKNVQNAEKIGELEVQIKRLRSEKEALEALLRPPSMPEPRMLGSHSGHIETAHLAKSDLDILQSLKSAADEPAEMSSRVNRVISNLGPAIDTFADGVHKINQYRIGADSIASQALATCAERLAQREKEGRKKALGSEEIPSPGQALSSVLRGLSKANW